MKKYPTLVLNTFGQRQNPKGFLILHLTLLKPRTLGHVKIIFHHPNATAQKKRLKFSIFRGSLVGAHRRGHLVLPRVPHPSPHHRQPAVSGTTTSRGRVRDGGLDLHHHLHLHHPPLHHPPPPPPPVVSGAAKLVKRAVITSDTQELSHADANCGQECFFL